jgi:RimJ/RimL family protein N-acetyltransferase
MLNAIVDDDWPALSTLLGGVDFAGQWFHFPEAFVWMRDYATDHPVDLGWWNYLIIHRADVRVIGTCGYKGAPGPDGVVEIGYEVAEAYRMQGVATEAARALCDHAFSFDFVQTIYAQTLAGENASVRLLRRLGFDYVGEMIDIEDGLLWEWEKKRTAG